MMRMPTCRESEMNVGTVATTIVSWPKRYDVLGVQVSATSYDELVPLVMAAARRRAPAAVDFMPVHGLVTAARNGVFQTMVNSFDVIATDGQPLRWALNWLHAARLKDRVYGPELMRRLCAAAESEGIAVYFYGSTPLVLVRLQARLNRLFPRLRVAGVESPPFRPLTAAEDLAAIQRINASGAGLVFVGLGCPRQEVFAAQHRQLINAVQLCVGAAFDFLAGTSRMAPAWMQRCGLEWLFRLYQEPGRLWRRYLIYNTLFVLLMGRRLAFGK
jgi:N-acetylglucosaminyldiphosphoundecaprenol N-acetyl-beta-D-mannosaminyltransferase